MPATPLLLFLLLLPPSSGCRIGATTECHEAPFVPGHNLAGEGFNIVKMATTDASVVDVRNFMVGGEDGNCTVCQNHLLNQLQKLPVSVLDWRIKVQCKRKLSSVLHESSQSVLKEGTTSTSVNWKVGLGLPAVGSLALGGTHSSSSSFATKRSSKDKYSFTSHSINCKYYTFRLHSNPPLSKEFDESLKNLPSTFSHKNHSAYDQFIAVYGTHFIRRVHLGGRVHSTTAIATCKASLTGVSMETISNCLTVEASATIKGVEISGSTGFCKDRSKKLKKSQSFSAMFSDRSTEVLGGDGDVGDLLFSPESKNSYKKWLSSLKKLPGVVSYDLSSLHLLVKDNPTLRSNLRSAIRDYVLRNAVSLACPPPCKVGKVDSNCACKCTGHQNVDSNCCPGKPGIAMLNVTVVRGTGLWGDLFSKTDGYVKVFYGTQAETTMVIWNNNFPHWNHLIQFGTVDLTSRMPVKFQVWDKDNIWRDNRLGKGGVIPTEGRNVKKTFNLNHGLLYVSLSVVCAPSLQGELCQRYLPTPPSKALLGYQKKSWKDWRWDRPSLLHRANAARNNSLL
ncbi:perforin-1.3 [Aplochiton taeniatus]